MVNRDKQLYLASANNKNEDLYTQEVRRRVKELYLLEDEVANLRKMLNRAFEIIITLHGSEISDEVVAEFKAYFNKVEQIKKDLKEEIGLNENTDI